jgi:tubulin alpha
VHELETREWKIRFRWVKAHAGTSGNELADKLAKEATGKKDLPITYNRVPKSVIKRDLENTSAETWQGEWNQTTKGRITKAYFPKVAERLHTKIHLTQNFTTMVTGHGNIKSYLYRFKIIDAPDCPSGNDNQTTEHILLEYAILHEERERLIASVAEEDSWPINKD